MDKVGSLLAHLYENNVNYREYMCVPPSRQSHTDTAMLLKRLCSSSRPQAARCGAYQQDGSGTMTWTLTRIDWLRRAFGHQTMFNGAASSPLICGTSSRPDNMAQLNCCHSHWPCCHAQIICTLVRFLSRPTLPRHFIRSWVPAHVFARGQSSMAMRCYTTYDSISRTAYTGEHWLHAPFLPPAHVGSTTVVSLALLSYPTLR